MNEFTLVKDLSNVNIVRRSFLEGHVVDGMNLFTLAKKHKNVNTVIICFLTFPFNRQNFFRMVNIVQMDFYSRIIVDYMNAIIVGKGLQLYVVKILQNISIFVNTGDRDVKFPSKHSAKGDFRPF
jgi:hypothetical protein